MLVPQTAYAARDGYIRSAEPGASLISIRDKKQILQSYFGYDGRGRPRVSAPSGVSRSPMANAIPVSATGVPIEP